MDGVSAYLLSQGGDAPLSSQNGFGDGCSGRSKVVEATRDPECRISQIEGMRERAQRRKRKRKVFLQKKPPG